MFLFIILQFYTSKKEKLYDSFKQFSADNHTVEYLLFLLTHLKLKITNPNLGVQYIILYYNIKFYKEQKNNNNNTKIAHDKIKYNNKSTSKNIHILYDNNENHRNDY